MHQTVVSTTWVDTSDSSNTSRDRIVSTSRPDDVEVMGPDRPCIRQSKVLLVGPHNRSRQSFKVDQLNLV